LGKMENGMKSVLNEIRIMRALSPHSQIVNLNEIYEGDNNIYIVIDLMRGGSLYSEMKNRTSLYSRREI
jgi:serine/threonine protein kinase